MPIKWPKNGIVGFRTGGSRGSDFVLKKLEMRAATTTAIPMAATIPVMIVIARYQCCKRQNEAGYEVRDATPLSSISLVDNLPLASHCPNSV
jgi:hypothetical protein